MGAQPNLHSRIISDHRKRRYAIFKGHRRRIQHYHKWVVIVNGNVIRLSHMRRKLVIRYNHRYIPIQRKGKKWRLRFGGRWRTLKKLGRYFRFRYNRGWKRILRFRLKLRMGRGYKPIRLRGKMWSLYIKGKWIRMIGGIRRYIRYKGRRKWLKRRRGKWKIKHWFRWKSVRIRK